MQTSNSHEIAAYAYASASASASGVNITDMADSVRAVEELLSYQFKDKKLLEEALTHPSYTNSASYQRLEFFGDSALGLAVSNFLFFAYPDLDQGQLTLLRAANISTETLARVAVRHGLYNLVRRDSPALDEQVRDFASAVEQETDTVVYGGVVAAPKVLADIVESLAAALYIDCQMDLQALWEGFRGLLEPIVTFEILQRQPHPVTRLNHWCQKEGKWVDIRERRRGEENIASVFVDGEFVASASSEKKEIAKLRAAKIALETLSQYLHDDDKTSLDVCSSSVNGGANEIEGAKRRLQELCDKKKWPKPTYRIEKEVGPSHVRRYICSVQVETREKELFVAGGEKSRVKDAENSAASLMILGLQESQCK